MNPRSLKRDFDRDQRCLVFVLCTNLVAYCGYPTLSAQNTERMGHPESFGGVGVRKAEVGSWRAGDFCGNSGTLDCGWERETGNGIGATLHIEPDVA